MGQQHRVRTKRKRRRAYLDRKRAASKTPARTTPREAPRSRAKKQAAATPKPE